MAKRWRPFGSTQSVPLKNGSWACAGPAMKIPGWSGRLSADRTRSLAAMLAEPEAEIVEAAPVELALLVQ